MAVWRRRLLRSRIWALSNCSMASAAESVPLSASREDAVDGFQRAGHLEVRQHLPQPVAPGRRRGLHCSASA